MAEVRPIPGREYGARLLRELSAERRVSSPGANGPWGSPHDVSEDNAALIPLQQRMITYRQMRRDPAIYEMLDVITTTALSAGWTVTPGAGVAADDAATLVRRQFGIGGEQARGRLPMDAILRHMLDAVYDGVHVLEAVPVLRFEAGRPVIYADLYDIDSTSMTGWVLDAHGQVEALRQTSAWLWSQSAMGLVPADRLVIATWDEQGDNPEGRALLRSVWYWWQVKRQVARSLLVGVDRLAVPIPVIEADEAILEERHTEEQVATLIAALYAQAQALRAGEQTALKTIKGLSIGHFGGLDTLKVESFASLISLCDQQIQSVGGTRFLRLGVSDAGARNVGEVHENVFRRSVQQVLDWAAATLTRGLIEPLVRHNFGPDAAVPVLRHEGLSSSRIDQALPFLGQLVTALQFEPADLDALKAAVLKSVRGSL